MAASTFDPVGAWRAFARAAQPDVEHWLAQLDAPEQAQSRRLMELLAANRETAFGRHHGFADIASPEQFRERVPMQGAAGYLPWLERASRDTQPVLTAQAPLFFERTSGSTARQKLIPYTPAFLREMQSAMVVWLADMVRLCPEIALGRAYWSMSPALQPAGVAPNGIRIGSASDLEYLGGSSAAALAATLLVPPFSGNPATWRYETLRALIADDSLALLSVWSPTFLASVLRPLFSPEDASSARELAALEAELPGPRAAALRGALADGHCGRLWPRLAAISCWLDGPSRGYAQALRERFPQARWLPKGLFATEGVVSIPFGEAPDCTLAVGSHYLEFLRDDGRICDVSALVPGDKAQVLMTTGAGLYRYALGDRIRITGMTGRTPRVTFLGRAAASCDLVGEKLDEGAVGEALAPARARGATACLVPSPQADAPHYVLLLAGSGEHSVEALRNEVEQRLGHIFHYAQARRLGQLGPLRARLIPGTQAALGDLLQRAAERTGMRAGDVKPSGLVTRLPLAEAMLAISAA
ncbi:GH3 family domain-containing protein [Paraburkholderia oxyphila]|uniref:GH3 family domain-containing protein n=1 Tax=Paraburkholderia oxyphila TaxID=614212 RepID=UPI000484BE93|nr:GH3 auxin-responsive promoter family protein [Paraburkholderia oxyphila]